MRWLVHGEPGVGKSYVIACMKELCTDVLKWQQGVEFQVIALQAAMAEQLAGDTIHHALGIHLFDKDDEKHSKANMRKLAKRLEQLRWLIIDEISMVSAPFLANIDVQLRSILTGVNTEKKRYMIIQTFWRNRCYISG